MEEEKMFSYEIHRLKKIPENKNLLYEGLEYLKQNNISVDINNYNTIYKSSMAEYTKDKTHILSFLYQKFLLDKPKDFKEHQIATSDIVAINLNGEISYHFFDKTSFKEIAASNYLANAEMSVEGNYNQIDGIINNVPIEKEESKQEKKPSMSGRSLCELLDILCQNSVN
ncbi:MAG: YodL domain-containing protein [Oscillospiraceae bacterium]